MKKKLFIEKIQIRLPNDNSITLFLSKINVQNLIHVILLMYTTLNHHAEIILMVNIIFLSYIKKDFFLKFLLII